MNAPTVIQKQIVSRPPFRQWSVWKPEYGSSRPDMRVAAIYPGAYVIDNTTNQRFDGPQEWADALHQGEI